MDKLLQTCASTQSFKSPKKLPLSPSTRKSWCQILTTLLITFFIVGSVACLENEQKKDKCEYKFNISTIICLISDSKLLGQLQNIGVLSAALLFFWDTFDRKKQLERQAWQLIDGAQGSETSGARKQAIEDLYKEGADITGLDADGADLRGINLSGADLTEASFKNAILEEANFTGAILAEANFTGANLQGANLRGSILTDANLTGADLGRLTRRDKNDKQIEITTKLQGANLRRAKLNYAKLYYTEFGYFGRENTDLSYAYFRNANIAFVEFKNANITGAYFGGGKTGEDELDIRIIRQTDTYKNAYYSQNFLNKYSTENLLLNLDDEYEKQLEIDNIQDSYLNLLMEKDNIALLSLIESLTLLQHILVEFQKNTNQSSNESVINTIISLKNKLKRLDDSKDSATQVISLAVQIDEDMKNQTQKSIEIVEQIRSKYKDNDTDKGQQ